MSKSFQQATHVFKGVASPYEGHSPSNVPEGAMLVDIYSESGQFTALSWLHPTEFKHPTGRLSVGTIYAHEIPYEFIGASLILTRYVKDYADNPLKYLLDNICPIRGEFEAIMALIRSITHAPLQQFVQGVLSVPDIYNSFWYCKAAMTSTASNGSLASNSRQIADLACQAFDGNPDHFQHVLTYGLLHDIGKVRCFREDEYGQLPALLTPENAGYPIVANALDELFSCSPEDGKIMDSLFTGRWRHSSESSTHYMGSLVHAFAIKQANTSTFECHKANLNWQPRIVK